MYKRALLCNKLGMEPKKISQKQLRKRVIKNLDKHPELLERFDSILNLACEKADGPVSKADEVELLLIEELRRLGNETLTSWAQSAEEKVSSQVKAEGDKVQQKEKKTSNGGVRMDK